MDLSNFIDHTILKSDSTNADLIQHCKEAREHRFFGVCVNSMWISLCKTQLEKTNVKVVAVIGFPLGACTTEVKAFETSEAIKAGADEIDMVIAVGALKEKNHAYVQKDIEAVVAAAKGAPVKVILETHLLLDEEKRRATEICIAAGAHFVKTSTGFTGGGATLDDIRLLKEVAKDRIKIKASGGVKTFDFACEMIEAGASRIGTSSGVSLVLHAKVQDDSY